MARLVFVLTFVPGKSNVADILTKAQEGALPAADADASGVPRAHGTPGSALYP